jgi:hypothetical protein
MAGPPPGVARRPRSRSRRLGGPNAPGRLGPSGVHCRQPEGRPNFVPGSLNVRGKPILNDALAAVDLLRATPELSALLLDEYLMVRVPAGGPGLNLNEGTASL